MLMKKLLLLVSSLFIFGCGYGGTGATTAGNGDGSGGTQGNNNGSPVGVGYLTFSFPEEQTTAKAAGAVIVPEAQKARYLISHFIPEVADEETGVITAPARTIVAKRGDLIRGVTPEPITLTVGSYRIEIVSYLDGPVKRILKSFTKDFQIQLSHLTTINIAMQRITAFTCPANIFNGLPYKVVIGTTTPLSKTDFWISRSSEVPFATSIIDTTGIVKGNTDFIAPTYPPFENFHKDYFQGKFTIAPIFLTDAEQSSDWQYSYPDPTYGEPQVFTVIDTEGGSGMSGNWWD